MHGLVSMSMNMTAVWLVAMIVLLKAPLWLQIVWFVAVSALSLLLTRPLAKKYVNAHTTATNADMAIGRDCVVTEEIDNIRGTGAVTVGGKIWTARMASPDGKAAKGETLRVLRIEGVKLIVEEIPGE